jgi:hypothetical protein
MTLDLGMYSIVAEVNREQFHDSSRICGLLWHILYYFSEMYFFFVFVLKCVVFYSRFWGKNNIIMI